jgi:2-haloacid dehalogenase
MVTNQHVSTQHPDLAGFRALSFDCYGTLIDWEAGIVTELTRWAEQHRIVATDDELLTAFAEHETVVQHDDPHLRYPQVLAETLRCLDRRYGAHSSAVQLDAFSGSVGRWPAFADTVDSLRRLHERFRLIILSNIDRATFATSVPHLGVEFDLVVTAQDVGAYKPSPTSFPALLEATRSIGIERSDLLHVAQSLYHDHEPAKAVGLPTVWIDRRHDREGFGATPAPTTNVQPDWTFPSMTSFADAVATP